MFRRQKDNRKKIKIPLALISVIALLLAGILVTLYEEEAYRAQKIREVSTQGEILSASVAAALVFNDDAAAQEYVAALQANPELEAAGVYDAKGTRVAGFARADTEPLPQRAQLAAAYVSNNHIYVTVPVNQYSNQIGMIYLRATMDSISRRSVRYGGIATLVVMGLLVLGVSRGAQRSLSAINAQLERQANELTLANQNLQAEMHEREKAEEALRHSQKMEAIGQLSGGIAHDFNNLLSIIKGNLQLLQRRITEGRTDVQRYLDSANEGVTRAASLTQRILAFSRRQPLLPTPLLLSSLIENMSDLLRHSVGELIEIDMQLNADWPVLCDASQMENVIINLAINARDAMPAGGTLYIETANRPLVQRQNVSPGDYVELTVRDTGTGMSEEVRHRAVDPFFTTKPQGRGTGLGLSTVFGYVRQSDGDLTIESELNRGTAIIILMPRFQPELMPVMNT